MENSSGHNIGSDKIFLNFIKNSTRGVLLADESLKITFVNEKFTSLTGIESSQIIGVDLKTILGIETFHKLVTPILGTEEKSNQVFSNLKDSNDLKPLQIICSKIENKNDGVEYYIEISPAFGTIASNQSSSEKEDIFRFIDQVPISVSIHSISGVLIRSNLAWKYLWGLSEDQDYTGLYNIYDDPQVEKLGLWEGFRKAASGETVELADSYYDPNKSKLPGRPRWISTILFPLIDVKGEVVNVIIIHEDLTERKLAESAMKESEKKFREIFNSIDEAVFVHDTETGAIIDVNHRMLEMYGVSYKEAIESEVDDLSLGLPPYSEFEAVEYLKKAKTEGTQFFEWLAKRKSGETFWVELTLKKTVLDNVERIIAVARDINEKKKTKKALQEIEERNASLLEAIPDLMFRVTRLGEFLDFRSPSHHLLAMASDEVIGGNIRDLDIGDEIFDKIDRCLDTGETQFVDFCLELPNGKFDFEARIVPCGTDEVIAIVRDVTDQKKSERELLESETRYRQLFEGANDAIFIMDGDKFVDCNNKTLEMFDCTLEDIINQTPYRFSPKLQPDGRDSRSKALEKIKATFEDGPQFFEWEHCTIKGVNFWAEVSLNILEISNKKYLQAIVRNINERKEAEEALHKSEERYRTIYENSAFGLYQSNVEGKFIMANPALIKMLGYEKWEEIRELDIDRDCYIDQNDRKKFKRELLQNSAVYGFETMLKRSDGEPMNVREFAKLMKNKDGEVIIEGAIEDITEKKLAEKAIIEAKEKAEKSDRLKSNFLAQMSHEIRTPINTILSFADLINIEVKEKVSEELGQSFTIINNAGQRIIRTIDLLLNVSLLQTGSYDLQLKEVELGKDIILNMYKEFLAQAKAKGLALRLNIMTENTKVYADEYTLAQMMQNLVNNAIKYTEEGHVEINVFRNATQNLVIEVADSGIGIAEDYLPHLFLPFSQEEQGYTRKYEGSGLGLTLVKKYCELNNAEILVESEKGKGTKFTVILSKSLQK